MKNLNDEIKNYLLENGFKLTKWIQLNSCDDFGNGGNPDTITYNYVKKIKLFGITSSIHIDTKKIEFFIESKYIRTVSFNGLSQLKSRINK